MRISALAFQPRGDITRKKGQSSKQKKPEKNQ